MKRLILFLLLILITSVSYAQGGIVYNPYIPKKQNSNVSPSTPSTNYSVSAYFADMYGNYSSVQIRVAVENTNNGNSFMSYQPQMRVIAIYERESYNPSWVSIHSQPRVEKCLSRSTNPFEQRFMYKAHYLNGYFYFNL